MPDDDVSEIRVAPTVSRRAILGGAFAGITLAGLADFTLAPAAHAAILWNHPLTPRGSVTHAWGPFTHPNGEPGFHNGIDYVNGTSTTMPVYSVAAGTVISVQDNHTTYGTLVKINHGPNVSGGLSWTSQYGHMVAGSFGNLKAGDVIAAATQVGIVGTTPNVNRHLHVRIDEGSTQHDPGPILSTAPLPGSPGVPMTQGDVMPKIATTTRTQAIALSSLTWAQANGTTPWPILPYTDNSAATNIVEVDVEFSTQRILDTTVSMYVSGLPTGEFVNVRVATQNKTTNVVSGFASSTFSGNSTGVARGSTQGSVLMDMSTTRLIIQAYASTSGVQITYLGSSMLYW